MFILPHSASHRLFKVTIATYKIIKRDWDYESWMDLHDLEDFFLIYCDEKNIIKFCFVFTFHKEHTVHGLIDMVWLNHLLTVLQRIKASWS